MAFIDGPRQMYTSACRFNSLLTQPYVHMFSVFSGDTSPVTRRIKTYLKQAVLYQDGQNVEENVQWLEKLSLYFSLV
jgi:hypothetical protein